MRGAATWAKLGKLHAELWAFRADMDARTDWRTPPPHTALRFAMTEAGEALDAHLRGVGGYARNHERVRDVFEELADCAMMLLTALPRWPLRTTVGAQAGDLDDICYWVARALVETNPTTHAMLISTALHCIATYPGIKLTLELRGRMAHIAQKHGLTPEAVSHSCDRPAEATA